MDLFQKVMSHKLCQNAIFENGGTTIQVSILHVLLDNLSIPSLPRVHGTSVNFEMQKVVMSCFVLKKTNKKQVAG